MGGKGDGKKGGKPGKGKDNGKKGGKGKDKGGIGTGGMPSKLHPTKKEYEEFMAYTEEANAEEIEDLDQGLPSPGSKTHVCGGSHE
jgi:hypothetical protein